MKKFLLKGTNINNKHFEIVVHAETKEHAAMTSIDDGNGNNLIKTIEEVIECVD